MANKGNPMTEMSNLAKVVYKRTYARRDTGKLENFSETVDRIILGNIRDRNVSKKEIDRLRYFLLNRKAGPAGRGWWFSGAPAQQTLGGVALNNCLRGSEQIITRNGVFTLESLANTEVEVWTKEGWVTSVVKSFGLQKVQQITMAPAMGDGRKCRSNHRVTVVATPDHGWILRDGTRTTELKVGDLVPAESVRGPVNDSEYKEGLTHGLIFGDGTKANTRQDGTYRFCIRMCGDRAQKHIALFKDITYPETYGGDPVGRIDSEADLKDFPQSKSVDYLRGFLAGWMEADGNWSKAEPRLSSQHPNARRWLEENAATAGFVLTGYSSNNPVTNFGQRKNPLYTFTLTQNECRLWKVESIQPLDEPEEVYCAMVPGVHAFTLASGIYTSNCWFVTADDWENFVVAQDLLMLGGGVGMSVEHRFVSKLPRVKKGVRITHRAAKDAAFIVPDSREGWCELVRRTLEAFFVTGKSFEFSTVCIRGAGERINGFGGTASGPIPLITLVEKLCGIFQAREGRSLRPVDAMDVLCSIGEMVVAGNVRRSAIIILGDAFDKEYLKAKRWDLGPIPTQRAMANLSVVCDDVEDLHPLFWKTYEQGEPFGIVNRTNIQKYGRMGELKKDTAVGVNPCVPAGTEILTRNGYVAIDAVLNREVEVWNGFEWSVVTPKVTGKNQPMVEVLLSDGRSLVCTEAHKWVIATDYLGGTGRVNAVDLEPGMKLFKAEYPVLEAGSDVKYAYTQGFISAEGMEGYPYFYVYAPKEACMARLDIRHSARSVGQERIRAYPSFDPHSKSFVPFSWSVPSRLNWLAGLADGDGAVLKEGGIQISSVDRPFLLQVQKMLTTLGTASKVTAMRKGGARRLPDGHGGHADYSCQDSFRLLIGAAAVQKLVSMGMKCERLDLSASPNRDASQFVRVLEVRPCGLAEEVYCFTESKRNLGCFEGIVTGQCAEATLEDAEPCNLQEIALPNLNDKSEFFEASELMTRWGQRVTQEKYHIEKCDEVVKRNRRIGTGVTGCLQSPLFTPDVLDEAYSRLQKANRSYAKELGIPESIRLTVVKPSGTMSKMLDMRGYEGIHAAYSQYYIQRIRFAATDPLVPLLAAAGHHIEPVVRFDGSLDGSTVVVDFYEAAPAGAPVADQDWDTWKQLDVVKTAQKHWADQSVSVTVYYKREDISKLKAWLTDNLKHLKTISFLCHNDHGFKQAPKEAISEEVYLKLSETVKPVDVDSIGVGGDLDGMECAGGVCPVK